jgi:hypothetical protein
MFFNSAVTTTFPASDFCQSEDISLEIVRQLAFANALTALCMTTN